MLQTTEANPASSSQRVSGELGCGSSCWQHWQKHLELLNCVLSYQNFVKLLTHLSIYKPLYCFWIVRNHLPSILTTIFRCQFKWTFVLFFFKIITNWNSDKNKRNKIWKLWFKPWRVLKNCSDICWMKCSVWISLYIYDSEILEVTKRFFNKIFVYINQNETSGIIITMLETVFWKESSRIGDPNNNWKKKIKSQKLFKSHEVCRDVT